MARYVDADKVIDVMKAAYWDENMHSAKDDPCVIDAMIDWSIRQVKDAPTEEVAPVVHSHWKEYEDYSGAVYPECARCGLVWWLDEGTAEDNEMYYCPKCGAKMDEVS